MLYTYINKNLAPWGLFLVCKGLPHPSERIRIDVRCLNFKGISSHPKEALCL